MTTPTALQLDALKEIVNTGVGKAASSLNDLLDSHIELEVPTISVLSPELAGKSGMGLESPLLAWVQLDFSGAISGTAALVFPPVSAVKLVAALTGMAPDTPGIDGVMAGTLNEVGNIIVNSVIGTLGNILDKPFDFSIPNYLQGELADLLQQGGSRGALTVLLVQTHFHIRDLQVEGNIFLIFELGSFDALLAAIDEML